MVGIGINLAAKPSRNPNIEDTLLAASIAGMDEDDLRVLALLVSWLEVHLRWVNVDRLIRAVGTQQSIRVRAFWTAIGRWQRKDARFARLAKTSRSRTIHLLRSGSEFQLRRKGIDARFIAGPLRVPDGVLRDRKTDILAPPALAKKHQTYQARVLMGPSYRADMWAALTASPSLSPTQLARKTYGSFASAWTVKRDWELLHDARNRGVIAV